MRARKRKDEKQSVEIEMKEFEKIGVKKRSKVLDWLNSAVKAVNAVRKDGYIVPAPGFHETGDLIPSGKTCVKIYREGGAVYAFLSDGKLYKESETLMTAVSDAVFTAPPLLATVYKDGKKRLLAVSANGGTLIKTATDPEEEISVPCGEKIAVFNGMLFSASKNEITVSKLFSFTDYSEGTEENLVIRLPEGAGGVKLLFTLFGELYALCAKSLFKLSPYGEEIDYKLVSVSAPYFSVEKESAAACDNYMAFVTENEICVYDGKSFKFFEPFPGENFDLGSGYPAGTTSGRYILPLAGENAGYALVFNPADGSAYLTEAASVISAEGGYAADEFGTVYAFLTNSPKTDIKVYTAATDLSFPEEKFLTEVRLYTGESATLTIKGDFGEKKYKLKSGGNCVFCSIKSRVFSFAIETAGENAKLSVLTVKYEIKGE